MLKKREIKQILIPDNQIKFLRVPWKPCAASIRQKKKNNDKRNETNKSPNIETDKQ